MRISLGLLLVGSVALVACSGDDGAGSIRRANPGATGAPADSTAPATTPAASTAVACPGAVPAATSLSAVDTNATDLRIVGGVVVYRDGLKVVAIDPASAKRSELYTSPDLVHSFADDAVLVTIESPNPPDAVLKVMPASGAAAPGAPGQELTVTPDSWSAGGTYVFGSDATSLYVLADVTNQGDTIYKVSKSDPSSMTMLAQLEGASLGDAQLAGTDVWFVRDQKRVYRVTQTEDATDPLAVVSVASPATEVFGIGYADCKLAVGGSHAFCSTGKALEQRSLTGGDLLTVLDAQKVPAPTLLGAAIFGADSVFVRSLPSSATDPLKNGIHAIKGTEDKVVACGRDTINSFAADSTSVVWAEQGKGVFRAPR
jgi:hypothetical protein